jgi:hypothetical protein
MRWLVLLLLLLFVPAAGAWTWPVQGPVLQTFSFDQAHPYDAGQHRGIAIGAGAGAPVLAPAAGVVSFAGTVPTNGKTLTIQTPSGLAVSLTHLGSIGVARDASVDEGAVVGTIGPSGTPEFDVPYVHLGIRDASNDQGYLDPLAFLPVLAPPAPAPAPASAPQAVPATVPAAAPVDVPVAAPVAPPVDTPIAAPAPPPEIAPAPVPLDQPVASLPVPQPVVAPSVAALPVLPPAVAPAMPVATDASSAPALPSPAVVAEPAPTTSVAALPLAPVAGPASAPVAVAGPRWATAGLKLDEAARASHPGVTSSFVGSTPPAPLRVEPLRTGASWGLAFPPSAPLPRLAAAPAVSNGHGSRHASVLAIGAALVGAVAVAAALLWRRRRRPPGRVVRLRAVPAERGRLAA